MAPLADEAAGQRVCSGPTVISATAVMPRRSWGGGSVSSTVTGYSATALVIQLVGTGALPIASTRPEQASCGSASKRSDTL
jgi:hypothetical protein